MMDTDGTGQKRRREASVFLPEQEKALQAIRGCAPSKLGVFRRAYRGGSLRAAINAKCLECIGYSAKEVRGCTSPGCPLWSARPYRTTRS